MKVLMTGATGLIGKELGKVLISRGYKIFVVTRNADKARTQLPFPCEIIEADLSVAPLKSSQYDLSEINIVINLAGESVGGGRWNEARKRRIYESRILGTRHLIQSLPAPPRVFINASAVGIYGSRGDQELDEESPAGDDFLAQACQDWEEELLAFSYAEAGSATRVIVLRTGTVLGPRGGAMEKLLPLFRRGLGAVLGEGKQWMSWIHIEDEVGLIVHAIENHNLRGPINLVSPNPVTNEEFSKTLASILGVHLGPRVPAMVLWASLGGMAALVLDSQKVIPQVALQSGYKFKYPDLKSALEQICKPQPTEEYVSELFLPWSPEQIFAFFSYTRNLQKITPPAFDFEILSKGSESLHRGSEIEIRLKIHGLPIKWRSLIAEWNPPYAFMDEQLEGPYTEWRHVHEFRAFAGGTLMVDRVQYVLPLGSVGSFLGSGFVRTELKKVFRYRKQQLFANLERDYGKGAEYVWPS